MRPVYSRLLAVPVVLALVLSLGMDRGTRQGYRILTGIAVRVYDGDEVAMRRLVSATRSPDEVFARRARWLLSGSLNPDNVPILVAIFETTDDERARTGIKGSLCFLKTRRLGRVILRTAAEQPGSLGAFAEALLAEPHDEAPTDEETRQRLVNESPWYRAYRESLFAEFEQADTLPERIEVLKELYPLGEERLIPYIDELLAQMDAEPSRSRHKSWKFILYPIVEKASLKKGTELPVSERRELCSKILSSLVGEKSSLLDLSGQPVKLKCPRIGYQAERDRIIYVAETDLEGIDNLELKGYRTPVLSIWEIKGIANKKRWGVSHLRFGRIYAYLDYAVVWVINAPTTCTRHPGPWLSGSGSQILLKKKDGEWRYLTTLSRFIA